MRLLAVTLLALSTLASANERWYQIDVLVFSQQSEPSDFPEQWALTLQEPSDTFIVQPISAALPMPERSNAQPLRIPFTGEQLVELNGSSYQPKARTLVAEQDRQLQFAVEQFNRQSRYSTLGYWSWYEPMIEGQSNEFPIALTAQDERGAWQLEGELSLRLSRFIHIDAKIDWQREVEVTLEQAPIGDTAEERMTAMQAPAIIKNGTEHLTIEQSARMRSEELHYLDHPEFGVLLRARPIEVSEP